MKILMLGVIAIALASCNRVPDKSIFEPLTMKELAAVIEKDTLFGSFYEEQKVLTAKMSDIEKARYSHITYRKIYKMFQYLRDTTKMNPFHTKWENEWVDKYGSCKTKVDSVLSYWAEYKANNSLDRYVRIEFAKIDKDYYSYDYSVRNVNLGFKLTPLQGPIQQIRFTYRYSAKIHDIYGGKHNCISTTPFSSPVVRYWEVGYSDKNTLENETTSSFIRDYDMKIEITDVRKDGVNYSLDDLEVPEAVAKVLETDSLKYPYLYASYKEDIIRKLLVPDYQTESEYYQEKLEELIKEKFPEVFAYIEYTINRPN